MYLDFYELNEKPFGMPPDTRFQYQSKKHQDASNHFLYGIREKEGFMVLTGDIGTGKTLIVRALVERLGKDTSSALLVNPMLEGEALLRCILEEFGIDNSKGSRKELIDSLNQFLIAEFTQARGVVLIIDEAQHLSEQALEEIRLLSNFETEKTKLLQIILVGQVELHQKLKSTFLRPLNQRISIRYYLLPMNRTDTEKYIYHRLLVAGSNGRITFSAGALNEIFKYSEGLPRLINLVCDRTLLAGYAGQSMRLNKKMVKTGKESLGQQGVPSTDAYTDAYTDASKKRHALFLGILVLVLGCIYFIGFQGEFPYVNFSNITPTVLNTSEPAHLIHYPIHTPSPDKGTSSSHPYSIHIASYRDKNRAIMNVNQLGKLGYEASIIKVEIQDKGTWYRVVSGKFQSKGQARAMLKKIKAFNDFSDARIVSAEGDQG